jgi:hypothetical protein
MSGMWSGLCGVGGLGGLVLVEVVCVLGLLVFSAASLVDAIRLGRIGIRRLSWGCPTAGPDDALAQDPGQDPHHVFVVMRLNRTFASVGRKRAKRRSAIQRASLVAA